MPCGRKQPAKNFLSLSLSGCPSRNPPLAEPQLVFDMVGNFAPSYTEYVTDYVLAEVWLPGGDGFQVHTMKGAHKTKILKGEKAK